MTGEMERKGRAGTRRGQMADREGRGRQKDT